MQLVQSLRAVAVLPQAGPNARETGPLLPAGLHFVMPLAIAGLWALAIQGVRLRDMTGLGLVSVMPVSALVLLALLTASFCITLRDRTPRPWIAFVHVAVLIGMLYGVTAFLEPEPRFSSVYRHVGIIDNIIRSGGADPRIDAYFNWPGFFALGAVVSQAAGFDSPLAMAAWGSLVFNFLFLPPLLVIFRWASDDPRVWWLGLWVFFSANWVGQDYLSPQAVAFTLWLAMLAALLTWFTPRPALLAERPSVRWLLGLLDVRRIRARLQTQREALEPRGTPQRAGVMVLTVVAIFAAMVTGHQLTPIAVLLAVGALVMFAGLRTRGLPIIMIVLLGAWISYQTTAYLVGHIEALTGPVGSTGANLGKNVTGRLTGSSDHAFIVHVRIVGSALIWLLAAAGLVRRLRGRRFDLPFVLIGASPFVLPILQPYGGEMLLRVFLFTLPVVAFLIASLAFPTPRHGHGWPTIVTVTLVCCALLGLFQFMRYGNERLDHFTRGDVAAVDALYRLADPGTAIFGAPNLPWKAREYAGHDYRSIFTLEAWREVARPDPSALAAEIARSSPRSGAFVIVTRSMKVEASLLSDKPGVLDRLVKVLRASPNARQLFRGTDGVVFYLAHAPGAPATRPAQPPAKRGPIPPVTSGGRGLGAGASRDGARRPARSGAATRPPGACAPAERWARLPDLRGFGSRC